MMNGNVPTASPGEKLDRAADTCPVRLARRTLAVDLGMGASPFGSSRPHLLYSKYISLIHLYTSLQPVGQA